MLNKVRYEKSIMRAFSLSLKFLSLAIVMPGLFVSYSIGAADLTRSHLRIPEPTKGTVAQYTYFRDLLQAALAATEDQYGALSLKSNNVEMLQNRQLVALDRSLLDILWTVTTEDRENRYLPIRVPLIQGLFGYRVFLIHRANRFRFDPELSIEQLKTLTAVQGFDWPDTVVLRNNGFNVATSDYYNGFKLLAQQFVDYYPRGVTEVFDELNVYQDKEIEIAPNHVLYYPNFMFFFVRKDDQALHDRILEGLTKLQANGTFDALFNQQNFIQDAISMIEQRKVHVLDVPHSESTTNLQGSVRRFGLP